MDLLSDIQWQCQKMGVANPNRVLLTECGRVLIAAAQELERLKESLEKVTLYHRPE